MKRLLFHITAAALVALAAFSCTTRDVDWPDTGIDPDVLYEITDVAFAEYMIHNITNTNEDRRLPYGTALKQDGRFYINKNIAATATKLYLVKDATRMAELAAAGVASAEVKIANLDGVQFFTNVEEIRLTSNQITGTLDLSMLPKLNLLEMNANYVSELLLPTSIVRLRYSASSSAPAGGKLTAIDLSACTALNHIHLPNHEITTAGLQLPSVYPALTYIDLSGNPGAPFTVPSDLWVQLTDGRSGVQEDTSGPYDGPTPAANYFEVPDLAFAEYLVFNCTSETDDTRKLPAGTAFKHANNKIYIDKAVAATATVLYVNKASASITRLTNGGVATASIKIENMDGVQFFKNVTILNGTSNALRTEQMDLRELTKLEELIFATAGVSTLDLSANVNLTKIDLRGSTNATLALPRLSAVNLSTNTKLQFVNLKDNFIDPANFVLPSSFASLTFMCMSGNKINGEGAEQTFTVPAALYDNLTAANDSNGTNRAGLVRGS